MKFILQNAHDIDFGTQIMLQKSHFTHEMM